MIKNLLLAAVAVVSGLALLAIAAAILAIPTYFLWNWLMPALFAIKSITFLQAIGVNFLTGCLFKSATVTK